MIRAVDCPHRADSNGEKALEAFLIEADGKRHAAGSICTICAAEWTIDQLRRWASWPISWALAQQPWLGKVEICFEGTGEGLLEAKRRALALHLEADKEQFAEMQEEITRQAGIDSLSTAERAQRVTLRL
jgi:hypothetical protein